MIHMTDVIEQMEEVEAYIADMLERSMDWTRNPPPHLTAGTERYKVILSKGSKGPWVIDHFEVSNSDAYRFNVSQAIKGRPGRMILPGAYTSLKRDGEVWMSDTPAEIWDHWEAIKRIEAIGGPVLIHGLGIGMVVKAALACPNVTRVDVVELDSDVIDLVGPVYADPRLHIHQGDALTYRFPPRMRWNTVWHDIWPTISDANLPQMHRLHRRYASRALWQGSWARKECEGLR